jgi:NADPH2:quinone reductase
LPEKKRWWLCPYAEKDDDIYSALQDMMLLVEEGKLKPVIDTRVAMADFERGYQRLTSRQAIGSIVFNSEYKRR